MTWEEFYKLMDITPEALEEFMDEMRSSNLIEILEEETQEAPEPHGVF